MCGSVVLKASILLSNHCHHPSPEIFSFCKFESLDSLNNNSCFFLPGPWYEHNFAFCLYEFHCAKYLIEVEPQEWYFCSWLTSLGKCPWGLFILHSNSEFPSFIVFYSWVTFHLSYLPHFPYHSSTVDTGLFPCFIIDTNGPRNMVR